MAYHTKSSHKCAGEEDEKETEREWTAVSKSNSRGAQMNLTERQMEMRKRRLRAQHIRRLKLIPAVNNLGESAPPKLFDPDPFDPDCSTWFPMEEAISKRNIRSLNKWQRQVGKRRPKS